MEALEFLRKIKSVTFATVENGKPCVRIIDVMLVEGEKLYFLTARGKDFYRQLMESGEIAIIGMDATYATVRVAGKAQKADRSLVNRIFEENPGLGDIYPPDKRDILEVFCLSRGRGEYFALTATGPQRYRFGFGGEETPGTSGFRITDKCVACGLCENACPVKAISQGDIYRIDGSRCLSCGRCAEICPHGAIIPPEPFQEAFIGEK